MILWARTVLNLYADYFSYCHERDFMSNNWKFQGFDIVDNFKDTPRYRDDIFTIDNPDFEKYIPDAYATEVQVNKANTLVIEHSFLELYIKVIGNDTHTSV